jgi:hypothetical protein
MSYGPYAPPQQYSQQPVQQQPAPAQYPQQQTYQPQQPYQPQYRVVERAEKDISEALTPKLTAILVIVSAVIVYFGVVIAILIAPANLNIFFYIGKVLAATGLLIFSIVLSLLSMQEKLEPRHKATYYAVPVLAIIGMVLLIGS